MVYMGVAYQQWGSSRVMWLVLQGILAVTLVRAKGLTGWQGEADPYVTLTLLESGGGTGNSSAAGSGSSSGVRQVRGGKGRANPKASLLKPHASSASLHLDVSSVGWVYAGCLVYTDRQYELCCGCGMHHQNGL